MSGLSVFVSLPDSAPEGSAVGSAEVRDSGVELDDSGVELVSSVELSEFEQPLSATTLPDPTAKRYCLLVLFCTCSYTCGKNK
jgi:hypothetical protein